MQLSDIRTYKLNVETSGGEGDFLREDTDLSVDGEELLHAAVTCGIPEEILLQEDLQGALRRRIFMMEYALDGNGEYLQKSNRILELDENIRAMISYYLGRYMTKLIGTRFYGIPFLVPVQQVCGSNLRFHGKRRSDLLGYHTGTYSVWEAIGRSNNSGKALESGCRQGGEILTVNGNAPEQAAACMTYYGAKCLSVRLKDAEPAKEGLELQFSEAAYFTAYYDQVYRLLAQCYERESIHNRLALGEERIEAEVEISEGRRLCVGMPRKLFFALREGDEAAVCAEAFKKREANTESHVEGYLGADGISVRFTESKRKSGLY